MGMANNVMQQAVQRGEAANLTLTHQWWDDGKGRSSADGSVTTHHGLKQPEDFQI